MKTIPCRIRQRFMFGLVALFVFLLLPRIYSAQSLPPGVNRTGANQDFSAVEQAVVQLLQKRDAEAFARALAPTIEDWQSILSTNTITHDPDPLKGFRNSAERQRASLEQGAKELLAKADALHLDFSKSNLVAKAVPPKYLGSTRYPTLQATNQDLPWVQKVVIVLTPGSGKSADASGNFRIALLGLMKFPGGWRCNRGVEWVSFPANVADEKTRRELAILDKASNYRGITDQEDPALRQLGAALIDFIRKGNVTSYQQNDLATAELYWALLQKRPGQKPSHQEFVEQWNARLPDLLQPARTVIQQMENAGIDFEGAEIEVKRASVKQLYPRGGPGSMDGLEGDHYQVQFLVKSDKKSKTGVSLSGDYVLAANEIMRFGDHWRITGKVRWDEFPPGVIDEKTAAAIKFENYVAENRALPPGTMAPDIEFVRLDNNKKMKLSDLRGKVVVLDFWATWCGPCQEPMARLQTFRQEYPDWKDQVAIVPISIDDTIQVLRNHIEKRGWTNTFNVWAGDGGWQSAPAKAFQVTAVPTTYIINQQGKIAQASHSGMYLDKTVNNVLHSRGAAR